MSDVDARYLGLTASQLTMVATDLKAENSKLRELVKRYHRLATGTDELWSWQSVYAELHELGIEVDK